MPAVAEQVRAPELRFPEFHQKWNEHKLGEVSRLRRGASPRPISSPRWFAENSSIGWVRISDVTSSGKFLKETIQYVSQDGLEKSRLVSAGSLIMSICATIGKPVQTTFDVCIHDGFVVFEDPVFNLDFTYYYLLRIQRSWIRYGQPGIQLNLNTSIVGNEPIFLPQEIEQEKIAGFLTAVDERIGKLKRKKELLEEYKRGMMQKLFSQEIRFKNEHGRHYPDWEVQPLSCVADFRKGKGVSKSDIHNSGKRHCIRYAELYTSYSEVISEVHSRTSLPEEALVLSKGGEVLIPASGETAVDMATASCLLVSGVAIGGDLNVLNTSMDGRFLAYVLTGFLKFKVAALSQGSSVMHLYPDQLKKLRVPFPSLEEQERIAEFLMGLDEKLDNLGQRIEKAEEFKRGLLQKMFV